MSSNALKVIAMISMLIDHIGYVLLPEEVVLRYIGRIAFPIYCFLLVEGFFHTRNIIKYLARMGIFALLSEIPFNLAMAGTLIYSEHTNVFLTLFIGLLVMYFSEAAYKTTGDQSMGMVFCIAGMICAGILHTDYSYAGVMIIYIFYLSWRGRNSEDVKTRGLTTVLMLIMQTIMFLSFKGQIENYAIISLVFILLYTGKKSGRIWEALHLNKIDIFMKYFFYLFYPLHLLVLYILK
ncbi:MAG: TraX family protein [Lachnospiraceae bacterium]|nr:TraX family protein [Lachnospiraceae bacterium]